MTLPLFVLVLGLFLFFAIGYSLPPLRAKARPFVDSIFNVLYQFSALFGWVVSGQSLTEYHILAWL
jgi:4-hydroxybenzoate polyprenyltransferase